MNGVVTSTVTVKSWKGNCVAVCELLKRSVIGLLSIVIVQSFTERATPLNVNTPVDHMNGLSVG